jgi:hypothetical protein
VQPPHGRRQLGYNTALLAHRLGDENVWSVDVDPDLVDTARRRLAEFGCHPHVATADGVKGWAEHGPYDRIIATCSVPTVPTAWVDQVKVGGKVLVDVKVNAGAGNLVLLRRHEDRLEGRCTPRWAAFMAMRHDGERQPPETSKAEAARRRETIAPTEPWHSHREVWLLACLRLPRGLRYGYVLDPITRRPTASSLRALDGSWCHVSAGSVLEAGPTSLWAEVERAWRTWRERGEPGWERFGLTATPCAQWWWVDEPGQVVG